ncbi:chromosome segregation protein sudA [Pyricularia oryzae]|uniref:Structural maintenance of chromosomes protein n=2 Tax=Pyricularia oryzae TaxID=318829 RepID=A0AA97PRN3_PYRO3|nr:chromosome segregation protein sudA [Pyricularia oryzae Y34]KAI7932040.1 chromosome segregation protein sudA [Pyricularia oryzae]
MYIKQIIIQGFKSYKEQTVIEPFSPGTNVIVGRNGSGKSNFFAAIRFVLSDAYTQMSREERQALLHEGSGSAVMTAYVEVIFDNSDDRFHTGNKEVSIKRTISLKKDEYSIDKKVVQSKNEVFSMLEMAGFSRVNPYYIVPQGRVTALTNMKEADRLKLLKEIAGTESYEARRTESRKIMHETINKREKIDELLKDVKERLQELEEEKEELRGFQAKDRERRCLEYAYYHHHQQVLTEALEEIEQARLSADGNSEYQTRFAEGEKSIAQLESTLEELQQSLEMLRIDRQQLENDRRATSKALAKVELKVKDLEQAQSTQTQSKKQHDAELKNVRAEIKTKEAELATVIPEYNKRKQKEDAIRQQYESAEATRQRLLDKQSRGARFKNKAERDKFLRREIQELGTSLNALKANRVELQESTVSTAIAIQTLEAEIAQLQQDLQTRGTRKEALNKQLMDAMNKENAMQDEKLELRREADKLEARIATARRQREKADHRLGQAMDSATSRALDKIARLKRERNIPGAYGILADLMQVDDIYRVPVEQVAGNSLFHYVVDNKETGTMILDLLEKEKSGRVTLMPLAQLRPRKVNMPRAQNAFPLIDKLQYDEVYDKAFQQVFGKSVLCQSRDVATQYSRTHNVDCVTMDGDTTSKRGAVSGGYTDPTASRLLALREANKLREEYYELQEELQRLHKQIELKSQETTTAVGLVRKLEQEMHKLDMEFRVKDAEFASKRKELQGLRKQLDNINVDLEKVDKEMKDMNETLSSYEAEAASEFKKALSSQEEEQLEVLGAQLGELGTQLADCSRRRLELERRKLMLENELNNNLRRREDELMSMAFDTSSGASSFAGPVGSVDEAKKELAKLKKRAAHLDSELRKAETEADRVTAQIVELENRKAHREQEQQELAREIEKMQKKLEKGLSKKAIIANKLAEFTKNIRDLGVLPEEAFDKYESMEMKSIEKRLSKVNEALKKYKHVNKKAFEQYNSFTTQQEQLVKRRKELDSSQQSIEDLISHLDQKKDEAIERTFKQVSREFATIFERLVPAGHGRLVIQRRADRRQTAAEESEDDQRRGTIENYTGVGISVSFNSKEFDEQQKIQQLSGGQKSLCALCLIFAIQQTESSPMVVFDEVDANLDAQYRTAVASLLQSISSEAGTQFICTTFRPEIVLVADKCYGVTFTNKTSSIDCVPTEAALDFVEGQQKR